MGDRENFYDAEIAPALLDLCKKCQDAGLSIVVMAEWEPGKTGRTVSLQAGSGFGIRMVEAAAQANGNVDSFMIAIMRHAREHGHSSAILYQLGVPTQPAPEKDPTP